ncbi:MAG TPA: 50S ribosomal protein L25/general stress protein Ctc [Stellaceae bacterium]|jgi:large subunit ribosomal protein L25|nr:50S ribosomal protein L25/general stress protein Ctc [Stellaceae bacterium]
MPEIISLNAEARPRAGKGAARATRRMGRIPAIVYGDHKEPVLISLEPRELARQLAKPGFFATLVDVNVDGTTHRTLPRDVQVHPVSDAPIHVDFMRVGAGAQVTVAVPVLFINHERSGGLRRGGILNVVRHAIEVVCPVDSIPDHLTVDLSNLDIGESIHIHSVNIPEGVRPVIQERDFTIASIAASSAVREEAAAAAATAAVTPSEEPAAS